MPSDAPAVKLAATRGYGAEVVHYERETSHRDEIANGIARERGATLVPPFDHERIVAGAGTVAMELLEDAGPLDVIVTPVGGGGLLAGRRSRPTPATRRSNSMAWSPRPATISRSRSHAANE